MHYQRSSFITSVLLYKSIFEQCGNCNSHLDSWKNLSVLHCVSMDKWACFSTRNQSYSEKPNQKIRFGLVELCWCGYKCFLLGMLLFLSKWLGYIIMDMNIVWRKLSISANSFDDVGWFIECSRISDFLKKLLRSYIKQIRGFVALQIKYLLD